MPGEESEANGQNTLRSLAAANSSSTQQTWSNFLAQTFLTFLTRGPRILMEQLAPLR
jgi:hypothetical protein